METRTTQRTVTFSKPFRLAELDEILPAGDYDIETDEEVILGISFVAWRRINTIIRLPSVSANKSLTRTLSVNADQLEEALRQDRVTPVQ
jgi:hypothetical protein